MSAHHHHHQSHDGHDHGAPEGHDHHHHHRSAPAKALTWALGLTAVFMFVEAAVGLGSGSLALLSDAGHMFSDAGALAIALAAQKVADRPRTAAQTFGFRRAETLAALVNAIVLGVSSVFIVIEAARRLTSSNEVEGVPMLLVAVGGLLVNLISARILSHGQAENANVRAAMAHVLADAAGSVAAIVAGLLVWLWDIRAADPIASILISILVGSASWRLVKRAANVLMESAPSGLDVRALEGAIRDTRGVADVHDLHAWRIEEGFDAVSVHVVLIPGAHGVEVASDVARAVRKKFGVEHVTVQPEAPAATQLIPAASLHRKRD